MTNSLDAPPLQAHIRMLIRFLFTVLRCLARVGREAGLTTAEAHRITAHDFASGGALEDLALELQLW